MLIETNRRTFGNVLKHRGNVLNRLNAQTQKMKGTVRPLQILTRKEFKFWHVWRFREEPDTDVMAKLFIHTAFFSGFRAHLGELRAALELSSGGLVLCQQWSSLGSTSWIRDVNISHTKSSNARSTWLIPRVNFTLCGRLPQTNKWKPSDELNDLLLLHSVCSDFTPFNWSNQALRWTDWMLHLIICHVNHIWIHSPEAFANQDVCFTCYFCLCHTLDRMNFINPQSETGLPSQTKTSTQ